MSEPLRPPREPSPHPRPARPSEGEEGEGEQAEGGQAWIDELVGAFLGQRERGAAPDPAAFAAERAPERTAEDRARLAAACAQALELASLIERKRPPLVDVGPISAGGARRLRPNSDEAETREGSKAAQRAFTQALRPGTWIGEYELLEELGRGGMGVVFLARQSSLDRKVALKILPYAATLLGRQVERFRREALAVARLSHPGIVAILAVGETDGVHHFAMEYVRGENLAQCLVRLREEREALLAKSASRELGKRSAVDLEFAARIAAEVGDALHYAHGQGIVHRDVKPQNVLLDAGTPNEGGTNGHKRGVGSAERLDGRARSADVGAPRVRARLVDFGLAKAENSESLTRSGDIAGTPFYMSPEQARARSVRVGPRSDVFSLGVVLYELLTLERPFVGDTVHQVLFEIAYRTPPGVRKVNPRVPKDLETICHKALEKNPDHRYASAGELAADLRRFLAHEAILARPPSRVERLRRIAIRHKELVAAALVTLAVVCIAALTTSRRVDARVVHRALVEQLERVDRQPDELEHLAPAELLALGSGLARIAELSEEAPETVARTLDETAFARLAALESALGERGIAWRDEFLARVDRPATLLSPVLQLEVEELFERARAALPGDPALHARRDSRPRLTIETDAPGDRVLAQRVDPVVASFGPAVELGTTPLDAAPLEPGLYRVVVERPGFGLAELSLDLLQRRRQERYALELRAADDVTRDMVLVPEGPFRYGIPGQSQAHYREREEWLPAFWIDRHEVSNAEYRAFVAASGHRTPALWEAGYDPAWDRLPVIGVSFDDARAYARWAGKRLPTAREWEKAARGVEGWTVPWGPTADGAPPELVEAHARVGRDNRGDEVGDSRESSFERYLRSARPVDVGAPGPFGLLNTLGNVAEWTETPLVRVTPTDLVPTMDQRVTKGGAWDTPQKKWELTWIQPEMTDAHLHNTYGFRCARSARPDPAARGEGEGTRDR